MVTITVLIVALCLLGATGALVALAARQKAAAYRELRRNEAALSRLALNMRLAANDRGRLAPQRHRKHALTR